MASAKNLQLQTMGNKPKNTFLFGKVGEQRFVLDYSAPMGVVQAFAAAMSVSHWQ